MLYHDLTDREIIQTLVEDKILLEAKVKQLESEVEKLKNKSDKKTTSIPLFRFGD
jgi:uncharacterized protein YlxW (UPF0749 family)